MAAGRRGAEHLHHCGAGDKVLLIDKHAAHERMNFDRMKAEGYDPMSQTLLAPAVCRLSPEEHAALTARLPCWRSSALPRRTLAAGPSSSAGPL